MEQNYEYYAFISYKREDEKWAKWLHRKLEGYRLPSAVCKETPRLPKRVKPIFRDKTDLGAGELTANIHSEMKRSRYLIVICSPQSAQSEWVGKEIEYFKELGRYENIIPFIVEGEPNSADSAKKCFNPALKENEKELLGINISEIGKDQAFIKVVAGLLDIRFDALWGRERRRQKRNNIFRAIGCFLILLCLLYVWDYNRLKIVYYKDYVEQWAIPQGIGRLSKSGIRHRGHNYKFEYRRNRLERLSLVNSYNSLILHDDSEHVERPTDLELFYTKENKIDYVKYLNKNGRVLFKKTYNEKLNTVIFQYDDEYSTELQLTANTTSMFKNAFTDSDLARGKVSRYLLTYDENGYVTKRLYAGFQNVLVGDSNGLYGSKYVVDDKGRVVEEQYVGRNGEPTSTKKGLSIKRHLYNDSDDWIETSYLSIDRTECDDGNGISIVKIDVDKWGNRVKEIYQSSRGELQLRQDFKIAAISYEYNDMGLCVKRSFFDANNRSCYSSENIAGWRTEYDRNGYPNKYNYFDLNNEPTINSSGYSSFACRNDNNGNVVEQWFYDLADNLVLSDEGIAGFKVEYDDLGNTIKYVVYGLDKQPIISKYGTSGWSAIYDSDYSRMIQQTGLGIDLQPILSNSGISTVKREYNIQGNITQIAFYDTNGNLTLSDENIAGFCSSYDDYGNEIDRYFFDANGDLCLGIDGYAKQIAQYEDKKCIYQYYGLDNNKINITDGYAKVEELYDDNHNIVERKYFDPNGEYSKQKLICKYKYDNRGNQIEMAVFDHNEAPTLNNQNWHKNIKIYNNRNLIIDDRYYGEDGELTCFGDDKYAAITYKYDNKGNRINTQYFDTQNNPCNINEGWSYSTYEFDEMNRVIKQSFFDVDKTPSDPNIMVPVGFVEYDIWGNITMITAGDGDGNYIINPNNGWAIIRNVYDNRNNVIETSYYDTNEELIAPFNLDYAKIKYKYNERKQKIEESYYGVVDTPILHKSEFAMIRYVYDNRGNIKEKLFYDLEHNLCQGKYGHAIQSFSYDKYNNLEEKLYLNHLHEPCNNEFGIHKDVYSEYRDKIAYKRSTYNSLGQLVAEYNWIDNEWVLTSESSGVLTIKAMVDELSSICPYKLSDDIEISRVYSQNEYSVIIEMKVLNREYGEAIESNLKNQPDILQEFKRSIIGTTDMPKNIELSLIIKSVDDNIIIKI